MDELAALEAVDFQWTTHIDSIWRDSLYNVPALHEQMLRQVVGRLDRLRNGSDANSPLGWVLVGSAGLGKTHLLSNVRREVLQREATFVLVDLTDVHDFWSRTLLGFLDSLKKPDAAGRTQSQLLLRHLVEKQAVPHGAQIDAEALMRARPPKLINLIDELVRAMGRGHQRELLRYQDMLRAFILFSSDEFDLADLGHAWLQGHGLGEEEMLKFGFRWPNKEPREVVQGLSWLISLRGPTLLALDQLDAVVSEHRHLAEAQVEGEASVMQQLVSRRIIEGLGNGLMALRDDTRRTFILVSCIEASWSVLKDTALRTVTDRYELPRTLDIVNRSELAEALVQQRLEAAYSNSSFVPRYSTWPFAPTAFQSALGLSPREILKYCEQHRRRCLERRQVFELTSFSPTDEVDPPQAPPGNYEDLDQDLDRLSRAASTEIDDPDDEELLRQLLVTACRVLMAERGTPTLSTAVVLDEQFQLQGGNPPLHARIRLLLEVGSPKEYERHFCLRVIEQTHHIAYQARLRAAMTASGIDPNLKFRQLMVVRSQGAPSGAKSVELTKQFTAAGGSFVPLPPEERRKLWALAELCKQHLSDTRFTAWLHERKPASRLPVLARVGEWLDEGLGLSRATAASSAPPTKTPVATSPLPIGRQVIGERQAAPRSIPPAVLAKHTVILAGSGSGKTVLVRRLVEEAALLGIPSIVIDGANDLARLGDPWPKRQESWSDEDAAKAERYHQTADVVVWTPGRPSGNPLGLAPLPDLAAVAHDTDELAQMVGMATESLGEIVAAGNSEASKMRRGVLSNALRYFATHDGGRLEDFVDLLKDLPPDAMGGISKASDLAAKMADALLAAMAIDPLLAHSGDALDPGVLFGLGAAPGKTRISVLNLVGLPSLATQQQFINQLAMTLFAWLKKHPCPPDRPLTGLLVVDEAKDFVPSQSSTVCKASLMRLAAQGRKYGLGLIFATQAPRSIDHNIIANCTTQFFGKANSPAAIEAVQEQLKLRGGGGGDIARLPRGRFYLHSDGMTGPEKVDVPLCLSCHLSSPLDEDGVLKRAKDARRHLGR
jgi:hypothetical protein